MQRPAKPWTSVRFRAQPPTIRKNVSGPGGGIGRRKGLKIPRGKPRAGSIPAPGTILKRFSIQSFSDSVNKLMEPFIG